MLVLIYLLSLMLNLLVIAVPIDGDIKYSTELTTAGNDKVCTFYIHASSIALLTLPSVSCIPSNRL